MKHISRLLFAIVTAILFISFSTDAQAKSVRLKSVPKSLQGTWHQYFSDSGFGETMHITKHSWKWSTRGRYHHVTAYKYRGYSNDYYLQPSNMQGVEVLIDNAKTNGLHRPNIYFYVGVHSSNDMQTDQYYKHVNSNLKFPHAAKTLKESINKPVFSTTNYNMGIADSPQDYSNQNFSYNFSNMGVQMTLKKVFKYTGLDGTDTPWTMVQVDYNGKTYFTGADPEVGEEDITQYNTSVSGKNVWSSVNPNDTNSVLLKYSQTVKMTDTWQYFNPKTGDETDFKYSQSKHNWYITKQINNDD
ncbi:hypothetical protein [Secundilactobacillus yichangensis]|uniref:hypothetical protein n=1 Tax=Secundilactobacillus yichangensis TaxID=2799580 RepID=UPI001944C1B3|nr:hypothetical protein [Secundilactobacillus yichangensis]